MPKAHDSAQLQSTVTGPMPKAHIRAQLKSTSKLIASCTNHDSLPVTARVAAAADHWHDSRARASGSSVRLLLLRLATMPKAHDRAQLKSTMTGPMLKAHISAQLKSTSKLIASCTDSHHNQHNTTGNITTPSTDSLRVPNRPTPALRMPAARSKIANRCGLRAVKRCR